MCVPGQSRQPAFSSLMVARSCRTAAVVWRSRSMVSEISTSLRSSRTAVSSSDEILP